MTVQTIAILIGAIGIFVFAVSPRGERLNAAQSAVAVVAIFAALVVLLPPGKLNVLGSSYEPAQQAATVDASKKTGDQVTALANRVSAIEAKYATLTSPVATPAQKQAAVRADQQAKAAYALASRNADIARRYLQSMNPFVPGPSAKPANTVCPHLVNEDGSNLLTEDGKIICLD